MTPEASLQSTVVEYLKLLEAQGRIWFFAPMAEGKRSPKRAGIAKKMGLKKAVPDLIIYFPRRPLGPGIKGPQNPSHILHIELKTPKGLLTKEQFERIDWLGSNGFPAVLCRSFDEAKKAVDNMMKVGRPWV
jgi:hypothetical protein